MSPLSLALHSVNLCWTSTPGTPLRSHMCEAQAVGSRLLAMQLRLMSRCRASPPHQTIPVPALSHAGQLPPPPGYASTSCLSLGCRRSCPGHGHFHTHALGGRDPYLTDSVLNGDLDLDAMTTPYGVTRGRYRSATSGHPLRPYATSLSPPSRTAVHHHHHHHIHHHYHYQPDQAAGRRSGAPHSAWSALPHRRPTSMSSVSLPYTGASASTPAKDYNGAVTAAQGPPAGKAASRSSSSHAPYTPTLSHQHASPRARSGSAGSGGSGHGLSHSSHAPSPPYGASVSSSSTAAAAAAAADKAAAAAWQLQHAREWQDWRLAAAAAGSEPGRMPTQCFAPTPTKSTAAAAAASDAVEGVRGGIPSTAEAGANTATDGTEGGGRSFQHAPSFAWMTRTSSPSASSPDTQSPQSRTLPTDPEQHVPGQASSATSSHECGEDSLVQRLVSPEALDRRRVSPHMQECGAVSLELALDADTALDVSWDLVRAANVAAEAAAEAAQAACQAAEWLQEHAQEHVQGAVASMDMDIEQGWRGAAARQQRKGLATNIRDSATSVDVGACASGRGLYGAPGGTAWASVGSPASVSSAGPRLGWGSIVITETPASPIHSIHSNGLFREAAASPAGAGRSAAGSRLASPSPLPHGLPPFAEGPMGHVGRSQEGGSPDQRLGFEVRATPGGVTVTTVTHGAEVQSDDEERALPVVSVDGEAEAGAVGRGKPPALELPGGRTPPLALLQVASLQGAWPAGTDSSLSRDIDGMLANPLYRWVDRVACNGCFVSVGGRDQCICNNSWAGLCRRAECCRGSELYACASDSRRPENPDLPQHPCLRPRPHRLPSGAGDDDDPHSGRYALGRSGSGRSCRSHSHSSSHPDSPSSHVSGYRVAATPDGGTLVTLGRRARQHSRMVPLRGPAAGDECLHASAEQEEGEGEQREVWWAEGELRQERFSISIGAGFGEEESVGKCGVVGADRGEGGQEPESPVEGDELTPHLPPVQLPPSPGESCGLLPGTPLEAHLAPHLHKQLGLQGPGSSAGSLAEGGSQEVDRPFVGDSWAPATPADSGSESEDCTFLPPPPSPGEVLPLPSPELPMPPCPVPADRSVSQFHEAQDSLTGAPLAASAAASVLEADGLEGLALLRASAMAECARAMGVRAGETSWAAEGEERCVEILGLRLEAAKQEEAAGQAAVAVVAAEAVCAAECALDGQAGAAAALEGMCEQGSRDLAGLASEEGAAAAAGVCAAAREAAAVRGLALGRARRMANVVAPVIGAAAADSAAAGLAEAEAVRGTLQAIEKQAAERAEAASAAAAAAAAVAEGQRRAVLQAGRRERRAVRGVLRAAEAGSARVAVAAGAAEEAACCRLVERLAASRLAVTLDAVAAASGVQAAACTAAGLAEQLAVVAGLCANEVMGQEQQQQRAALQASRRERRARRAELKAADAAASASASATVDGEQAACLAAGERAEEARVRGRLELVSGAAGEQALLGVRSSLAEQAAALCAGHDVVGPAPTAAAAACISGPSNPRDSAGRGSKHGARRGKAGQMPVAVAVAAAAACVGAAAAEAPAASAAAATPAGGVNAVGGADAEAPIVPVVVEAAEPLEPGVAVDGLVGGEEAGPVHGVQGDAAATDSPPNGPNTPCAKGREVQGAPAPEGHRVSAEGAKQQGCAMECTGQAAAVAQKEDGVDEEEDEQEPHISWAGFGVGLLAVTGLFTGSVLYLGSSSGSCAPGRGCGVLSARGGLHPSQLPNATCTAPWLLTKAVYRNAQQQPEQQQLHEAFASPQDPPSEAGGAGAPPVQREQPAAGVDTMDDNILPQAGQDLASPKAGAGESAEAAIATATESQATAGAELVSDVELQAEAQAKALLSHPQYAASQVPGWLMHAFMRPGGGMGQEGGAATAGELEQLLEPQEDSTGELEEGGPWAGNSESCGSGMLDAGVEEGEPAGAVGEEALGEAESLGIVVQLEGHGLWEEAKEAKEAAVVTEVQGAVGRDGAVGTEPELAQRGHVAALATVGTRKAPATVGGAGVDGRWAEAEGGQHGADDEAAAKGLSGAPAVLDVQQHDASASTHDFPPPETASAFDAPSSTLAADSGRGVPPSHAPAQHFAYAGLSLAACVSGCVAALLAAGRVGRRAATAAAVHVRHVWDVDPRSPPLPMPYTPGSDGLPSRRPPRIRTAVAAANDAFGYLGAAVGAAAAFAGGANARAANRQQPQQHPADNWGDDGYDGWYGGQYDDMDAGDVQDSPSRRSPSRGMGAAPADYYWLRPNLMVPRASPARSFGGSLRSGGPHGEGSSGGGSEGGHRHEDEPSVHCGAAGGVEFHWLRNRTVWTYDEQAMSREARALLPDSPMFRRARQ